MTDKIQWSVKVNVASGPSYSIDQTIEVGAYCRFVKLVPGKKQDDPPNGDNEAEATGDDANAGGQDVRVQGAGSQGAGSQGNDEVQPVRVHINCADAGPMGFLLITSDVYSEGLTFSINSEESTADNRLKLDSAQFLPGSGAVSLLGDSPGSLFFYNETEKDANISILVASQIQKPGEQPTG